jgi:RNA polymerase sigma factor (sigma-70 family)
MEQQFETLEVYTNLAKKIISKFAPTFYIGLRKELLSNDDAISDIASAIMMADWKWDANRKGHEGQSKTRYSYRNQCGIWAIKTYISSKYKKKNQYSKLSIDSMSKDELNTYASNIPDRSVSDPYEIVSCKEESDNLKEDIQKLLNSNILSDKQRNQIYKYYFENKTLVEIGKEYGVTREAIRQNIQKGLNKIKSYA